MTRAHVDIEIRIVDVQPMCSLLEVDMRNAIVAHIVVIHYAKLCTRCYAGNQGSRSINVVCSSHERCNLRLRCSSGIAISTFGCDTELIQVDDSWCKSSS